MKKSNEQVLLIDKYTEELIRFLNRREGPPTTREIMYNSAFRGLAEIFRYFPKGETTTKHFVDTADYFNHIACHAIPESAVRNWVHHNGHIPESH